MSEEDFYFYKKIILENLDYVSLYLWEDENKVIGFSGINNDELIMLFLDSEFIGKGYGNKILLYLVETKNIKRFDVNTQNEHTKKFYLNHIL